MARAKQTALIVVLLVVAVFVAMFARGTPSPAADPTSTTQESTAEAAAEVTHVPSSDPPQVAQATRSEVSQLGWRVCVIALIDAAPLAGAAVEVHVGAAWQQAASSCVDHAYMIRQLLPPDRIHNYAHNEEWLVRTYNELGRAKDALAGGRPLPMVLREQRVWGVRERLFERVLPRLTDLVLANLLHGAHQVDGIVKGLQAPGWPRDPWQALHRLALGLTAACAGTAAARR